MRPLIVKNLTKSYKQGVNVLDKVSFEVKQGEFIAVIGASGSGKSTMLRCINRMIEPTSGSVIFEGQEINNLKGKRIREVRKKIGMIFQHYNLVYRLTVMQNVMHGRLGYMSTFEGVFSLFKEDDKIKALKLLNKVGLGDYVYQRASDLSGGQKQRVGIVRALMQQPSLLLCDEPIASLDPGTSKVIMETIKSLAKENNIACIVNLHQVHVAKEYAGRIIGIHEGKIVFDDVPSKLTDEIIENIYDMSIEKLMIQGVKAVV